MQLRLELEPMDEDKPYFNLDSGFVLGEKLTTDVPGERRGNSNNVSFPLPPGTPVYDDTDELLCCGCMFTCCCIFSVPSSGSRDDFVDGVWTSSYDHPLLRPATPSKDADAAERKGYIIGLFCNPVFPDTLSQFERLFFFKEAPSNSVLEGGIMLVWDWKKERQTVAFVRRRIGFDNRFAVFDIGIVDHAGRVGLCICNISGTEVTGEMSRRIEGREAVIPLEFWHASVTCEQNQLTYIRPMSMSELEARRRRMCSAREWSV